jgi:hypothetical protein
MKFLKDVSSDSFKPLLDPLISPSLFNLATIVGFLYLAESFIATSPFNSGGNWSSSSNLTNNILFSRFEEELNAIIPSKELKETLNLAKDVAVLKRVRKGYDINNKLIEYTINYYDASLYTYKIEVAQIEKVK